MKSLLILIFILLSVNSFSQERALYGRVLDKDKRTGIPYCVIQQKETSDGRYTDENGRFSFSIYSDSVKTLIFYCLGYERREVSVKDLAGDSAIVELQSLPHALNEVAVTTTKGKLKQGVMGKKNLRPYGICTGNYGQESAIWLSADSSRHGYLKEVFFYIVADEGIPNTKFRMHVYNLDSSRYWPDQDITDSNVILHADKGDEWVSVDLSPKKIPVGRGVFISMEWISGRGNDPRLINANHEAQRNFNGQVLAFTQGYYKQGSLMYSRRSVTAKWNSVCLAGTSKRNVLNPMVYCTYNYIK